MPPKWIPDPVVWENYPQAFQAVPFHLYFWNTLQIVGWATAGTLLSTSLAAFAFAVAFAPHYTQFMGRVGMYGMLIAGAIAAVLLYATLQRFVISREAHAFSHQLYDCLELTLLGLSSRDGGTHQGSLSAVQPFVDAQQDRDHAGRAR